MDILLTGGSACGKSSIAEDILETLGTPHIYIATMIPYGEDGQAKVERHRRLRAGKGFKTVEKYVNISQIQIEEGSSVLLECICNLTANEMFDKEGSGQNAVEAVLNGVNHIREKAANLIVITNEVGNDGGQYDTDTLKYIENMGIINNKLTNSFPTVYELCCGIPLKIKGELPWEP